MCVLICQGLLVRSMKYCLNSMMMTSQGRTIARAGQVAFMSDEEMDKIVKEKKKELEELVKEL